MRRILAANVLHLLNHHHRSLDNLTARQRALAKECGIAFSTVQRICKAETGATIENIESIAGAFHLAAYQILIPTLDPTNPTVIQGATAEEQRLYRLWQRNKLPLD